MVLILLIIVVVLVLGVGGFFLVSKSGLFSAKTASVAPSSQQTQAPQPVSLVLPSVSPSPSAQVVYDNPFEQSASYENPFEESYENPFNNI